MSYRQELHNLEPADRDALARDLIGCFPVLDKSDRADTDAVDGPTVVAERAQATLADHDRGHYAEPRPRVICLCGSTRFKAEFERVNREMTLTGTIVVAPGVFGHADGIRLTETEKANLDRLHLQKIALSDSVFVVNPGGYVGESTRNEIAFAQALGKPVSYLEPAAAVTA